MPPISPARQRHAAEQFKKLDDPQDNVTTRERSLLDQFEHICADYDQLMQGERRDPLLRKHYARQKAAFVQSWARALRHINRHGVTQLEKYGVQLDLQSAQDIVHADPPRDVDMHTRNLPEALLRRPAYQVGSFIPASLQSGTADALPLPPPAGLSNPELMTPEDTKLFMIVSLLAGLLNRDVKSAEELRILISDLSDAIRVFREASNRADMLYNANTADKTAKARQKKFDDAEETIKPLKLKLYRKICTSPFFQDLPDGIYANTKLKMEHFIAVEELKEIPALKIREKDLVREYRDVESQLKVTIDGQQLTLKQAQDRLVDPDESVRKNAWLAIQRAWLERKPALDELLTQLLEVRAQIATERGFADYRAYKYFEGENFDYTLAQRDQFLGAVAAEFVPLWREIQARRAAAQGQGLDTTAPWNQGTDKEPLPLPGQKPLDPFQDEMDLLAKMQATAYDVNPEFARVLAEMQADSRLDVEPRPNKKPTAGTGTFPLSGTAYFRMTPTAGADEVITASHEPYHAFDVEYRHDLALYWDFDLGSERSELSGKFGELLSMTHWENYYADPADLDRARRNQLEYMVSGICKRAAITGFEDWLYTHPGHSVAEREAAYKDIMQRYGFLQAEASGYEKEILAALLSESKVFRTPYYTLDYALISPGAIDLYEAYLQSPERTLVTYLDGIRLGSSRPLAEVYQTMGIEFDLSAEKLRETRLFVESELGALE